MLNIGPSFLGGVTAGVMLLAVNYALPEPAFVAIRDLSVSGGYVTFDRAVRNPDVYADIFVSVVDVATGETVCKSERGAEFTTSEDRRKVFSFDDFTGNTDCAARLDGEYRIYLTLIPRDGRRPVQEITQFSSEDVQ